MGALRLNVQKVVIKAEDQRGACTKLEQVKLQLNVVDVFLVSLQI